MKISDISQASDTENRSFNIKDQREQLIQSIIQNMPIAQCFQYVGQRGLKYVAKLRKIFFSIQIIKHKNSHFGMPPMIKNQIENTKNKIKELVSAKQKACQLIKIQNFHPQRYSILESFLQMAYNNGKIEQYKQMMPQVFTVYNTYYHPALNQIYPSDCPRQMNQCLSLYIQSEDGSKKPSLLIGAIYQNCGTSVIKVDNINDLKAQNKLNQLQIQICAMMNCHQERTIFIGCSTFMKKIIFTGIIINESQKQSITNSINSLYSSNSKRRPIIEPRMSINKEIKINFIPVTTLLKKINGQYKFQMQQGRWVIKIICIPKIWTSSKCNSQLCKSKMENIYHIKSKNIIKSKPSPCQPNTQSRQLQHDHYYFYGNNQRNNQKTIKDHQSLEYQGLYNKIKNELTFIKLIQKIKQKNLQNFTSFHHPFVMIKEAKIGQPLHKFIQKQHKQIFSYTLIIAKKEGIKKIKELQQKIIHAHLQILNIYKQSNILKKLKFNYSLLQNIHLVKYNCKIQKLNKILIENQNIKQKISVIKNQLLFNIYMDEYQLQKINRYLSDKNFNLIKNAYISFHPKQSHIIFENWQEMLYIFILYRKLGFKVNMLYL